MQHGRPMERSRTSVVEEASLIVMERMWREPGGAVGDGLAINFGARSVAHMCTQDMHSERDERNSQL